jgi:exodeoxyribonuclease VIII
LVFEPQHASTVWCGPETRRGKDWAQHKAEAEANGALLLTEGDYKIAVDAANAVRSNKEVAKLLSGDLVCEASIFAKDTQTGVDMRCRPDGWRRDIGALIDLKTTIAPDPEGFAKQVANFGYHIQESFLPQDDGPDRGGDRQVYLHQRGQGSALPRWCVRA